MAVSRRGSFATDLLGLAALLAALVDYLRPSLLLIPTVTAGGDTPCHYPTAVYFHEHLLPSFRFHGWYPGAYLGHPLLLYYFPLPFLVMSALAPLAGMPVAFKLGTAAGVFLVPLCSYLGLRLMGFGFPSPLLGAAASVVFLFLEENPIWGGTMASTLTGEFSYTYGIALAVLFMGSVYRTYSRGASPVVPAVLLAVTALAHGYAVLWAGLSATFFLYAARRPARTLAFLATVAFVAFALVGFWVLPLLADWGWTTPYDDPWITVLARNLVPSLLWPLFAVAAGAVGATLAWARRTGGPDFRLLYLFHCALVGAALAAAGPALGIIDVRFVPFAQLALCLLGGAALGLVVGRLAAPAPAALALLLVGVLWGDTQSRVLRYWIEWNYSGLEAKELWPAFRELTRQLRGTVSDPRVAVEYSQEHERAGSIRMYETFPFFSGRSTLEGVYNQASLQTHPIYYLASELGANSPNPFRSREYSQFDTDSALRHLRLFNVSDVVALSPKLVASLESRSDVERVAHIAPYSVFHLRGSGAGYVEPLDFAPIRSSPRGWRDKAYRWFTRKPLGRAHLVFTDDARFEPEPDEWLAPPEVPLPGGVDVRAEVGAEQVVIHTNRPGHPLLVKISYHPRWHAEGADGPFLTSPALMTVIPRQNEVRLVYARTWADRAGIALTLGGLAVGAGLLLRRPRASPAAFASPALLAGCPPDVVAPRRWGLWIPVSLLIALSGARLVALMPRAAPDPSRLYEKASRAYAAERFEDTAEYARHALGQARDGRMRGELACLRGESLLRLGRPGEAAESFDRVIREGTDGPYVPQALFGAGEAYRSQGRRVEAAGMRDRLLAEFPDTPWARRARDAASLQ